MPNYWVMNDRYNEQWDKKLNELLDKYDFTNIDWASADLGNNKIWVANYPYSCFIPYDFANKANIRASRLTILRAKKKIGRIPKQPKYYLEKINQMS